jgi:hypothetical protein
LCEKYSAAYGGAKDSLQAFSTTPLNFFDRHFDWFCEAKPVKMAIKKEYYLAAQAAK